MKKECFHAWEKLIKKCSRKNITNIKIADYNHGM